MQNTGQGKSSKYRFKAQYSTRGLTVTDLPDSATGSHTLMLTTADGVKVRDRYWSGLCRCPQPRSLLPTGHTFSLKIWAQAPSAEDKVLWLTAFARPSTNR